MFSFTEKGEEPYHVLHICKGTIRYYIFIVLIILFKITFYQGLRDAIIFFNNFLNFTNNIDEAKQFSNEVRSLLTYCCGGNIFSILMI